MKLSCGKYSMFSKRVENNNGVSRWEELLQNDDDQMIYPKDETQMPDVFLHLCKGEPKSTTNPMLPMSFARFNAAELLKKGFTATEPEWVLLKEDKSLNCLADGEFPGNVLIMIGLGKKSEWYEERDRWETMRLQAEELATYHLRVHLFQARDIPDADMGGGVDPFFKINYWGREQKTSVFYKNKDPLVYQTLTFDSITHSRKYPPQVCYNSFHLSRLSM